MILTFKPQFVEPIKAGTKIHTIREDKNRRWKPEMKIQFWNGNPRNVNAKPYQFQSGICTDVKDIYLNFQFNIVEITGNKHEFDRQISSTEKLNLFAINDGFESWEKLKEWVFFNHNKPEFFKGKLIYFKVHATI